jgi:hypothetical protein
LYRGFAGAEYVQVGQGHGRCARKKVSQKSGLNRSILDQGWGEFRRQLDYKLAWNGGTLLAAPLKAVRYATEGVKSMKGDDLGLELSAGDILAQALGCLRRIACGQCDRPGCRKWVDLRASGSVKCDFCYCRDAP